MSSPMPTAPEPGPGQAVVRVRWTETVERVADVVLTSSVEPTTAHLDAMSALWEVTADRGVHPVTGAPVQPVTVRTGRRMADALLMSYVAPTTPEEG